MVWGLRHFNNNPTPLPDRKFLAKPRLVIAPIQVYKYIKKKNVVFDTSNQMTKLKVNLYLNVYASLHV